MENVRTSVRLEPDLALSLDAVAKSKGLTKNAVIAAAVARYAVEELTALHQDIGEVLDKLAAYRAADPKFEKAIAAVAVAEAEADEDPAEGRPVAQPGTGPVTKGILGILDG